MQIGRFEVHGALAVRIEKRRVVGAKDVQNAECLHGEQRRSAVARTAKQS